jgi:hypothetical protein
MNADKKPWPFDQPRNCVTFTTRYVMNGSEGILGVYHDADDHGWQFIGPTAGNADNGVLVCLHEIVSTDPSVMEVGDLNPGWCAIRSAPGAPWKRRVNIRELSREEFLETFCEPMERLTESYRPIPLKDYVSESIRVLELPTTIDDIEIHDLYLSGNKKHSHVLFFFGQPNRYLIIVIDHETDSVAGYRVLDLAAEYGLKQSSPV